MRTSARYTVSIAAVTAMLSGCGGGSGVPLNASPAGVTPDRTRAPVYSLIYSFHGFGKDGAYPSAGVINVNGMLYGTTHVGGGHGCDREGCGTVYRIKASGKETILHRFKGGPADGQGPQASLLNVNGTLYGTTTNGGTYGNGTVFAITKSGRETVLYSFKGGTDGANPVAPLLNVNGTLYGTTFNGGAYNCGSGGGCGTVFSITPSGQESVLYSFKGGRTDGQNPVAGLINVNGTLYGTTSGGGVYCFFGVGAPCGTVFSVTPSGEETVLYSFKGGTSDGQGPDAGLIYVKGKFYGTTTGAGTYNLGTVFAVTSSGTETVLHSFGNGNDGTVPQTGLVYVRGKLYGTTEGGGYCHHFPCGTVFSITTSGKETVRYSFKGGTTDGQNPVGDLINVNDTLYGTTNLGGSAYCTFSSSNYFGCGSVFALKP
ncbi:MAG: choice-of-anchor tandem repeat GloVer-containing protein [Candidatus Cybelea sp.]